MVRKLPTWTLDKGVLDMIKTRAPPATIVYAAEECYKDDGGLDPNILLCFAIYYGHWNLIRSHANKFHPFSAYNPLLTAVLARRYAAIEELDRVRMLSRGGCFMRGYGIVEGDGILLGKEKHTPLEFILARDDDDMLNRVMPDMTMDEREDIAALAARYAAGKCYARFKVPSSSSSLSLSLLDVPQPDKLVSLVSRVCSRSGTVTAYEHARVLRLWTDAARDTQLADAAKFLSQDERAAAEMKLRSTRSQALVRSNSKVAGAILSSRRCCVCILRCFIHMLCYKEREKLKVVAPDLHRNVVLNACHMLLIDLKGKGREAHRDAVRALRNNLRRLLGLVNSMHETGTVRGEVLTSAALMVKLTRLIAQNGVVHDPAAFEIRDVYEEHVSRSTARKTLFVALYEHVRVVLAFKRAHWLPSDMFKMFRSTPFCDEMAMVMEACVGTIPRKTYTAFLKNVREASDELEAEKVKEEPDAKKTKQLEMFIEHCGPRLTRPRSLVELSRLCLLKRLPRGTLPAYAAQANIPGPLRDYLSLGVTPV